MDNESIPFHSVQHDIKESVPFIKNCSARGTVSARVTLSTCVTISTCFAVTTCGLSPRLPWWILTYRLKYANIPKYCGNELILHSTYRFWNLLFIVESDDFI